MWTVVAVAAAFVGWMGAVSGWLLWYQEKTYRQSLQTHLGMPTGGRARAYHQEPEPSPEERLEEEAEDMVENVYEGLKNHARKEGLEVSDEELRKEAQELVYQVGFRGPHDPTIPRVG